MDFSLDAISANGDSILFIWYWAHFKGNCMQIAVEMCYIKFWWRNLLSYAPRGNQKVDQQSLILGTGFENFILLKYAHTIFLFYNELILDVSTIWPENLAMIEASVFSQDAVKVSKRKSEIGKVVRGYPTMIHAVLICGLMVTFCTKCL